ncbi:hypothetical protein PGB90_002388 [Kerria lacca]
MKIFIALIFVCYVVMILAQSDEELPDNSNITSHMPHGILPSLDHYVHDFLEMLNDFFST